MLGVDVGTTFTAAAAHRDGRTEIAGLGNVAASIPSLVFLRDDGEILVGEAAERRGVAEPHRLAREFKRRIGDETPIMLAGSPYSAERLIAAVLRETVAIVAAREGADPTAVAVTHPANWGSFKTDLLRQACELAGLREVTLVSEPVAAAVHYSATERVEPGAVVAVYDLGGGTFDAAVLRRTDDGFATLGDPEGIERLGGIDFDAAVFAHVRQSLGGLVDDLQGNDPNVRAAMARLRHDCVAAKEALSFDTDATVPVALPNVQTQVRLTRPEFETMIRPPLQETIEALRRALANAGVTPGELAAVLLVGGSSRIPLVAEMVGGELGRPVATDVHPKHAVALGAALVAAGAGDQPTVPLPPPPPPVVPAAEAPTVAETPSTAGPRATGQDTAVLSPGPEEATSRRRRTALVIGGLVVLLLLAVGAFALAQGGGDGETSGETTAEESPETVVDSPCGSSSGRCAVISNVTLEGSSYVVEYEVTNFDPVIYIEGQKGTPEDHHVHFFFNTTSPENAGTNGSDPGEWTVWDRESGGGELRFDGYRVSDRDGATQLCAAVADEDHAVESSSGNCVDLPPDPVAPVAPRRTATTPPRAPTTRPTATTAPPPTTSGSPQTTAATGE